MFGTATDPVFCPVSRLNSLMVEATSSDAQTRFPEGPRAIPSESLPSSGALMPPVTSVDLTRPDRESSEV